MKHPVILRLLMPLSYLLMITVNALANILPINGLNTGEVSDAYPNLFAPAAITFSIWGVIYLLLGIYVIVQLFSVKLAKKAAPPNWLFVISCVVNSAWIFAWHYQLIGLSVLLMLALLFTLIKVADWANITKLSLPEKLIYKVPFGIYFGWITVATIANITAFLVSFNWNGFGLPDTTWMVIVLLVGVGIASWRMHLDHNLGYGLVPVWAYFGIWLKHTAATGFNGNYPIVINAVIICQALLIAANSYLLVKRRII